MDLTEVATKWKSGRSLVGWETGGKQNSGRSGVEYKIAPTWNRKEVKKNGVVRGVARVG